jgi:large subunit ribosomal protein L29
MRELKAEKIRDMTEEEIEHKIQELHEEIFNLRFRNAMRQLQNPLLIRERRRDIARMSTILMEHRSGVRKLGMQASSHELPPPVTEKPKQSEAKAAKAAGAKKAAKPKAKAKATAKAKAKESRK